MANRIAVIGAGPSGLCALKSCLEEHLEPVCYEKTSYIGGLWYYTSNVIEGRGCVMKSTVINTSKETMVYSDFPPPADCPVYMHNTKLVEYLKAYASHFDLKERIRFEHEVLGVVQAEDFAKRRDNGTHVGYEDKKVLVVGIGNSGGDVAVELSRIAKPVLLSTRRGSWVMNRIEKNGLPIDILLHSRVTDLFKRLTPRSLLNWAVEARLNARFDHELYGLKPEHRFDSQHPMVNDELPNRIASGTITIKPDVKKIGPTSVEFVDGSLEDDIDAIILATGYNFGFPFIDHPALEVKDNVVNLYKYVFPPDIQPSTLAVIGCVQPLGAVMPISEIQCRWAVRVFKGLSSLPSSDAMWTDIRNKQRDLSERYVKSRRHTIQVEYIEIMDDIGSKIGSKPDLGKLFWKDPRLAWHCFFGPYVPYQYRLVGPHPWNGAREAIMTVWDRTLAGISPKSKPNDSMPLWLYAILMAVLAVVIKWLIFVLF
ncbi:hypothetical protein LSH36_654g01070 [Paralvinella palmiformis]|uniref:Flavin-containing monooxygenase n=1 Tax=Paralvinella palmiformis TaxID=53620 RepID=A0AAD9J3R7_9ANNE|nr:hypothetical protein LSH36_654g01070 [Paralvinella palmiformis]